jgi:hypothetical protein
VEDLDARPGRGQDVGPDDATRAVGAVEHDPEAAGLDRASQPDPMLPVAIEQTRVDDGPTDVGVADRAELLCPPDQLLDLLLDGVVELESLPIEDLEPVVIGRVMGRRDHDPGREVAGSREEREGGRGDAAGDPDIRSEAGRPGRDRRHEHVAGAARVLADDELPALPHEPVGRCAAEGVGQRRLELDVGDAADPIAPEQAGHGQPPADGDGAVPVCDVIVAVTVGGSTLRRRRPAWRVGVGWSS